MRSVVMYIDATQCPYFTGAKNVKNGVKTLQNKCVPQLKTLKKFPFTS